MVNSKIILAVAGSGKTYHIAKHIDPLKKNLLITYTRQNVSNLRKEIIKRHKEVPKNTQILTFSSFVYRWLLKPFEPILKYLKEDNIITEGVEIKKKPPMQRINGENNRKYFPQGDYRHYIYFNKYYSSRMSTLFTKQPANIKKLIYKRLSHLCDQIYFDELQDFMGNDFEILTLLLKEKTLKVSAVGDFHQHSVSKSDYTSTKPFKKGKHYISKTDYKLLFKDNVVVDETTLMNSRRVPKIICDFISTKLNVPINSCSPIDGHLELLTDKEKIYTVLEDNEIHKLVYSESRKYPTLSVVNWGYSKGDTYRHSCVILTGAFESLFKDHFNSNSLSPAQINTLYVAMTRATHTLYIVRASDFKKIKPNYYVNS